MKKNAQVWIETVLYTLIGLSLIAIVLAFVTPKITEAKDRAIIEQTISSLNQFDDRINTVLQAPGNIRSLEFTMKRGDFYINSSGDELLFILDDLKKPFSEPGVEIPFGRIKVYSENNQKTSSVYLKIDYGGKINITYQGEDNEIEDKFNSAPIPYKFFIESKQIQNGLEVVDIKEVSGR